MRKDIETRDDIELLVNSFYEKVKADLVIGYIFTDVFKVNWEKHLPKMYDFWENNLFYTGTYSGNPMISHQHLHKMHPLSADHFERWVSLFTSTVDELFHGAKAKLAKQRANSISAVLQTKLFGKVV